MTIYSHSRLSCYEQCPARFKYRYIDKVDTEEAESVEAFLGSRVHEALEQLYLDLQHEKVPALEDLQAGLVTEWDRQWTDDIVINSGYGKDNYQRMALRYLADYYRRYAPFTQTRTIALEQRVTIRLDPEGSYVLQGYIDRLAEAGSGSYEIHDYKTYSRLPLVEYLQADRQLALYMIGVLDSYPDASGVELVWHFLKFDKEVRLSRTPEELATLRRETIGLIDSIEADTTHKARPGALCKWCEFQGLCGQWAHRHRIRELPANEYLAEPGVALVNRYAQLREQHRRTVEAFEEQKQKLEEALVAFAAKEAVDVVFGSRFKVRVSDTERLLFPAKGSSGRSTLEELLRRHDKFSEVASLDTTALSKALQEGCWDASLCDAVKAHCTVERAKRLYLSRNRDDE